MNLITNNISKEQNNNKPEIEENRKVVNKRKSRYRNSEVKKGGSTNLVDIQGTARKKYLHIWTYKNTKVRKIY